MIDETRKNSWNHFGKNYDWRQMSSKSKVFEFKSVDMKNYGRFLSKGYFQKEFGLKEVDNRGGKNTRHPRLCKLWQQVWRVLAKARSKVVSVGIERRIQIEDKEELELGYQWG